MLVNLQERKKREFASFKTIDDVINILKSQFASRNLFLKYSLDKAEATINEYFDDKTFMVITDPNYQHEGTIAIYGLSDKYIEVEMTVVEDRGPGYYRCKIKSARRATQGRRHLRFKLNPGDAVATNFKVSKHTIDISSFNIPTSIKVVLEQFQSANSRMSDIVKVDVFGSDDDPLMVQMRKTGKSLFIADVAKKEDYGAVTEDFVDCIEIFGNEIDPFLKKNVEKGYKSIVTVPIIYITESESSIPFGYIQMISKSKNFEISDVLSLKDHSFKLVDRIRDANTIMLPMHQNIIDISRGGAKLGITDDNLKKYLAKSKGFIFDIVFKLQAPITIYGEIKVSYTDDQGTLYLGVDFEGNSSRKDEMKRFISVIKPMETDYKSRLIKTMKQQKKVGQ
ncbi:MAG: DUF1577 domain-containing protein [Spirochaetes bacterium]|nr:DUF1577 domain-containing protein [Spirochaetota bacterium]